jgi:predicted outer membrane protein
MEAPVRRLNGCLRIAEARLTKSKSFDRDYVKAQVKEHEKAVKLFQKQAQSGQDLRDQHTAVSD